MGEWAKAEAEEGPGWQCQQYCPERLPTGLGVHSQPPHRRFTETITKQHVILLPVVTVPGAVP